MYLSTITNLTSYNTQTRLMALCPGLPGWASTRKVKPIWILLEQETVSGSGISWAVCKSAPRSRQITTPAPHRSVFLQAGCPSCHPTNSVKALKATKIKKCSLHNYTTSWHITHLDGHGHHVCWPFIVHNVSCTFGSHCAFILCRSCHCCTNCQFWWKIELVVP